MAAKIPQQFIDELLARVDIVDVIERHVSLRKAGRDYMALCPFHDEKSPSFSVSQEKQFYYCFGCGAHGSAIGFLMDYEHMEFVEAVEELATRQGIAVPSETAHAKTSPPAQGNDLYALLEEASKYFRYQLRHHPKAGTAIDYLKARGLSGDIAAQFGIGFAPPGWDNLLHSLGTKPSLQARLVEAGMLVGKTGGGYYDRFRDRIMFPIRDRRGRTIGFGGRVLGDETPKYLNSPETPVFHKGAELYGLYQARQSVRHLERLLVVEGYMDVVTLAQHGIPYSVATLGTAITREHLNRAFRAAPEVVFCFDGDRAGREAAWRALDCALTVMREGREARFMFLPEGEDPDSLVRREGRQTFEDRIAHSVPLSTFFFESLAQQVDISSVDGRARLVELARPYFSKLAHGVFRHLLLERLAKMVGMDAEKLAQHWDKDQKGALSNQRPHQGVAKPPLSLVRRAIALLLQDPRLAQHAENPRQLLELQLPGIELLVRLLELAHAQPHVTCGALVEHWRGSEEGRHLAKLAQWQHPNPKQGLAVEFDGTLALLHQQRLDQRVERLLSKQAHTDEEKMELKQYFTNRPSA